MRLLSSLSERKHQRPPRLFALLSHPLADKYIGPLAPLLTKFDILTASMLQKAESTKTPGTPGLPVFVAGAAEYITALKAMWQHQSQLVWFRWLYVLFSRYMWVNEWIELINDGNGHNVV